MQQVLPASEMIAVGALNSVRGNFAFIVGPGLAGVIAAKGGATAAFAVDGLSYLVSIATIVMMRPVARMTLGNDGITLRALLEGWRYARGRQDLLGTYLIDINATFFGMPNALFPAMAEQWGTASVGLLYAAPSLGAMIAALTSGWASGVRRHGLAITWAAALWGVAIAAFGFAPSLWLALIFLAAARAADMVNGSFGWRSGTRRFPRRSAVVLPQSKWLAIIPARASEMRKRALLHVYSEFVHLLSLGVYCA